MKNVELNSNGLEEYISQSITEYNNVKPHYFHKIYTPGEVYENPELKDTKIFFEKLNKERIAANKTFVCGKVCP